MPTAQHIDQAHTFRHPGAGRDWASFIMTSESLAPACAGVTEVLGIC